MNKKVIVVFSVILISLLFVSSLNAKNYSGDGTYNVTANDNVTLNNGWKLSDFYFDGHWKSPSDYWTLNVGFNLHNPQGVLRKGTDYNRTPYGYGTQTPGNRTFVSLNHSDMYVVYTGTFQNISNIPKDQSYVANGVHLNEGDSAKLGNQTAFTVSVKIMNMSQDFSWAVIKVASINQPVLCSTFGGSLCDSGQLCYDWHANQNYGGIMDTSDSVSGKFCCVNSICSNPLPKSSDIAKEYFTSTFTNKTPITSGCVDSDGGINFYKKGFTWSRKQEIPLHSNKVQNVTGTVVDSCSGSYLLEGYCGAAENYSVEASITCDYGCANGACLNASSIVPPVDSSCINTTPSNDYSKKGSVYGIGGDLRGYENVTDSCFGNFMTKNSCYGPYIKGITVFCSEGCVNGACVDGKEAPLASNTYCRASNQFNGKINYSVKGALDADNGHTVYHTTDGCWGDGNNYLAEYYCFGTSMVSVNLKCLGGCHDGACSSIVPISLGPGLSLVGNNTNPENSSLNKSSINNTINTNTTNSSASANNSCTSGCLYQGKCLDYGYRTTSLYCGSNNSMINQVVNGNCNNNFECTSNVCVDRQCTTPGLFQRFLNWLKTLLGV